MALVLTLIRGLPGSGKSTLAKSLCDSDSVHLEADMYFVNKQGEYCFDALQLPQAHQWCQTQSAYYLSVGKNVIVSNTFIQHWEMKAYRHIAKKHKAQLEIKVCRENYGTIHDIEPKTLAKMARNWQE
ncbi:AAA family ATPase [Vibrio sp. 10N.286.49.B3]|uniref:ATP-binding protein n=1 Tax=Vibrio sp. 10N.286.49.B3 TaxID=1880855 RepID=UPI000C848C2E|nr:ATP-binding protein [Vibrio sp. 10N.286.49.B3]PMH46126.1 AAA family ATPase [Vibrio sp. 10N.286.49.B3]